MQMIMNIKKKNSQTKLNIHNLLNVFTKKNEKNKNL